MVQYEGDGQEGPVTIHIYMPIPRLKQLGLSEKEAKVYIASLEVGAATADELAKHAKLNRSTTYVQIQELMRFGLMSTFKKGKRTYFAPESPYNLRQIIERKHRELNEQAHLLEGFVPELLSLYATSGVRPIVRSFEGKEGLIAMRREVLKTKSKEIHLAVAYDHMRSLFSDAELMDFSDTRAKQGIKSYVLYTKTGDDMISTQLQDLRRIAEEQFPFSSDIYIFGDMIAFASYGKDIAGVIIESATIAATMRSLFRLAWNQPQNNK